LSGGRQGGLIVFEGDKVVGPFFIEELLHGLILSMEGVHFDQAPRQIRALNQLANGRDFVGLVRHGFHSQATLGAQPEGGDQRHSAMVERLTVEGDLFLRGSRSRFLIQPGIDGGWDWLDRDELQGPKERGFTGHFICAGARVDPAVQGPALGLGQASGIEIDRPIAPR
jgi:alkanesulfonate monooxygenase SsuD/methylene tetrahydromethanopterin reductase-like flavin-dependent oxidoreductase (luciferase family)